jgi:hypothetical protein
MDSMRRRVIGVCSAGIAAALLAVLPDKGSAFSQEPPSGLPNNPGGRRRNPSDPEDPNAPVTSRKAVLEEHQKNIKKDIEKLFDLAKDLKDEVERTDATAVLSIAMLKKTEEIEKLAKQIREHAKG